MKKNTVFRSLIILFLLSSLSSTIALAQNGSSPGENVTILIYHKFGEDQYPTTNVGLDAFAEQLLYLREHDYKVITLSSLIEMLKERRSLPDKTVVITIDDAYGSTYTGAWPLLQKYGYPFTVFIYAKAVARKYSNYLTREQIIEMQRQGVDFQDHGYSHHRFGNYDASMDENEYRRWISDDLHKGRKFLAELLGRQPSFLALPYGEYNSIILSEAKKVGYQAVLTQDPGSVSSSTDRFMIPREPILGNEWATIEHFAKVLGRVDLPLTDMQPGIDPLTAISEQEICATLINAEQYKRGSLGIYLSELGWQSGRLAPNGRLCVDAPLTLSRRSNRVAVSGVLHNSNLSAIRYWLLIQKGIIAKAD